MSVPITVVVSPRPREVLYEPFWAEGATFIFDQTTATMVAEGNALSDLRVYASEPEVFFRNRDCQCCAIREDLVCSVVRATRRAQVPNQIVIFLDPTGCDVLVAISTILSSVEITRRSSLDAVLVHVDAGELATRLTTGGAIIDDWLLPAIAVADRFILGNCNNVRPHIERQIRAELMGRSGFAKEVLGAGERCGDRGRLQAWHVAPEVRSVEADHPGGLSTVVLRADQPLDEDAINEWFDWMIASHASRLFRLQGTLSVQGNKERRCCHGVLSFAGSHAESTESIPCSSESVIAISGVGLDGDELMASFAETIAS
ncbi:MAG: GTP-binding protein [Ilumatobacteraceae bacterium]|nr:GTP-binding protein [Ilumatobacteraceae bacterium]